MTTVTAGSPVTFTLDPFAKLTMVSSGGVGTVALVSSAPKLVADQTLAVQNGTFGPYGVPMAVTLTVRQGSVDYTTADSSQYSVSGGGNPLIGSSIGQQQKSDADALESGALYQLDLAALTLGLNSAVCVRALITVPNSAATKRIRGRFGGVVLWNLDLSTHLSYPLEFWFSNQNSLSAQKAQANNLSWAVPNGSAAQSFSVDFATAQQLTITAQWPVAGAGANIILVEDVKVFHYYRA